MLTSHATSEATARPNTTTQNRSLSPHSKPEHFGSANPEPYQTKQWEKCDGQLSGGLPTIDLLFRVLTGSAPGLGAEELCLSGFPVIAESMSCNVLGLIEFQLSDTVLWLMGGTETRGKGNRECMVQGAANLELWLITGESARRAAPV